MKELCPPKKRLYSKILVQWCCFEEGKNPLGYAQVPIPLLVNHLRLLEATACEMNSQPDVEFLKSWWRELYLLCNEVIGRIASQLRVMPQTVKTLHPK